MSETASYSKPWYIGRHWRGELPLGESFWRNGLGLALLLALIEFFATMPLIGVGNFQFFQVVLVGLLVVNGAFLVWVCVGIWRSANRHWQSRVEAILAKVVVVVGAAYFILHASLTVAAMTGFLRASR